MISSNQFNLTDSIFFDNVDYKSSEDELVNTVEWVNPFIDKMIDEDIWSNSEYQRAYIDEPGTLFYLFSKYKSLSVVEIDKILDEFVKNKINFDEVINIFSKSPNGELLDLAKSALRRFDETEYHVVIDYLKNMEVDEYIKAYFVEAIIEWNSISTSSRLKDIQKLKEKIDNDNVFKKTLTFAISELS